MASSEQQAPATASPAAEIVGNAFVEQYYHMLHESPQLVHKFYQDVSKLGRPEKNGIMGITTTLQEIDEKILSLGEFVAEITSVDAQESYLGGVLVLVTGFMSGKDGVRQKFTQCFFLAPQEKGYFVLNDAFRYVDENGSRGFFGDVESPVNPDDDSSLQQVQVMEQKDVTAEDLDGEEIRNPESGQAPIEDEEAPIPEVVDEIPDDSLMVVGSTSIIEEEPKKSYASIVKVMKEIAAPSSVVTAASVRSASKSQEQNVTAAPPAPTLSENNGSNAAIDKMENTHETEAEGYSIYVRGLPLNATPALLENEFKKFGPIKSGGIQVRTQKGFCFGFVEFEVASAVQSALEASPVIIGDCPVAVEEKRSTNRGNSGRSRFTSGRGSGYRNEGGRGRGNYGNSRSYSRGDYHRGDYHRGDYHGRGEYGYRNGNRGGFSNRGGDGFQRGDHAGNSGGNSGGRVIRTGGLAANSRTRTTSVHVPATA